VRRNWFVAAIVIGVVAIVIAAIAMRLSDDSSSNPSATEWANSVCASLATWKSSMQSLTDVQTLNADTLDQKIEDGQAATSTLVDELKALGRPDLESGAELQQELSNDVDQLQSSFDSMKETAQQITESGSFTLNDLAPLLPQFQALVADASKTVDALQNANVAESTKPELQAAFADAQSCQDLETNG